MEAVVGIVAVMGSRSPWVTSAQTLIAKGCIQMAD